MLQSVKSATVALIMTLLAVTGMVVSATAPANAKAKSKDVFEDQMEVAVIKATNSRRATAGVGGVSANGCVDGYAETWATYLAARNLFEHRTDLTAILGSCKRSYVSENLAKYPVVSGMTANQVARRTVQLWMNSPGHRANLLSGKAKTIGVGVSKSADGKFWLIAQNFTS